MRVRRCSSVGSVSRAVVRGPWHTREKEETKYKLTKAKRKRLGRIPKYGHSVTRTTTRLLYRFLRIVYNFVS